MDPSMMLQFWDNEMVSQIAFHPRQAEPLEAGAEGAMQDGTIEVADGVQLGYRMYKRGDKEDGSPPTVLVFHHGNAELSTDLEGRTQPLHDMGCAVLAIDYRGFGWSSGKPALSHLSPDANKVAEALPGVLEACGMTNAPCVLWGRSIGATCAVELATSHSELFKGVIIESGLMDIKSLGMVQMLGMMMPGAAQLLGPAAPDPLGTMGKLPSLTLPALILHGQKDEIVPVKQSQNCHDGIASETKTLRIFEDAGHNDVQATNGEEYLKLLEEFVKSCSS